MSIVAGAVPRSKFRRILVGATLTLAAVLTVLALLGWWLARGTPEWFGSVPRAASRELGETLEHQIAGAISDAHPYGAEWTLFVSPQQMNAWLRDRLPLWIENQGGHRPEALRDVAVETTTGSLRAGAVVVVDGAERFVGAVLAVRVDGSGRATAGVTSVMVGRLSLPAWMIAPLVQRRLAARGDTGDASGIVRRAIDGTLAFGPIKLDDGRVVRVLGVEIDQLGLRLHCVTDAPVRGSKSGKK